MDPLYRVVQVLTNIQLLIFNAMSYAFGVLYWLVSWTRLQQPTKQSAKARPEPINKAQTSALYRVERLTWTNSRCAQGYPLSAVFLELSIDPAVHLQCPVPLLMSTHV